MSGRSEATSEDSSEDERPQEEFALLGLLDAAAASRTPVVHVPSFLSLDQVSGLREWHRQAVEATVPLGSIERGADGATQAGGVWRTDFLHTNGLFGAEQLDLRQKLYQAMQRADRQNWAVLSDRPEGSINFRTVECHQYGPGGCLAAPGHIDSGT